MATNHALFFIMNGPKAGKESQAMECYDSMKSFWAKSKDAGDIDDVQYVMLASSGNHSMPAGFWLVTGDRAKLHSIRWDNNEFLNIHTMTMVSMEGYACIDGYAGAGYDQHMERIMKLMKS